MSRSASAARATMAMLGSSSCGRIGAPPATPARNRLSIVNWRNGWSITSRSTCTGQAPGRASIDSGAGSTLSA